jgi:trimeric autotransporter adhesin
MYASATNVLSKLPKGTALQVLKMNAAATAPEWAADAATAPEWAADTDTTNTAGSSDISTKIFLIGNGTQSSTGAQTYSDNEVFVTNGVLSAKDLTLTGDIAVNGGDITSTSTSFNLLNSNVTALSIGSSATTVTIPGNLTVTGTFLTKDSQEVNIGDAIILLNAEEIGTPSENAGIEIERGTSSNVGILWNETTDRFTFTNNGTNYYNIPISTEYTNNTGTVTSVGLSMPTGFTVTNSPVETSGTLTVALTSGYEMLTTGTQTISGTKTFSSTITGSISGNAGTVTNGVYTNGTYSDPAWITSLAASKLSGTIPSTVLGNSSLFIGTTSVALNRASATLALAGVTNTNWDAAYGWGNHASAGYALNTNVWNVDTSRTANSVLAAPNGSAGSASFRSLVYADLTGTVPTWNQNTSGSAGSLKSTGTTGLMTITGPTAGTTRAMTIPDSDFTVVSTTASQVLSSKTLTAPRITSASHIADSNGNELITFPSVISSAVNELYISNATTTNAVTISTSGGDANIPLSIGTKGTGALTIGSGGLLSLSSTGTASVSLDSGTTGGINIGTGLSAKNITVGNVIGATSITLSSGTGGLITSSTTATGTGFGFTANNLTTGDGLSLTSTGSSITTGKLLNIVADNYDGSSTTGLVNIKTTSSGRVTNSKLLNIVSNGTNATAGITTVGAKISVTDFNLTSGTNVALELAAATAVTDNIALKVTNGRSDFQAITATTVNLLPLSLISSGRIAIGTSAAASGTNSLAIGISATTTVSTGEIAIGSSAAASNTNAIAIGTSSIASGQESIAIGGAGATYGPTASGQYGISVGSLSDATTTGSIALGYGAQAITNVYTMAIGDSSSAAAPYSIAIGKGANVASTGTNSVAIGYGATESTAQYMQLGNSSYITTVQLPNGTTVTSDVRDKTDIKPIESALDFLTKIETISYVKNDRKRYQPLPDDMTPEQLEQYHKYEIIKDWDKEAWKRGDKKSKRRIVGVKAQQIQKLLLDTYGSDNYADIVNDKFMNRRKTEDMPDWVEDFLLVKHDSFIPFLIRGIQEQQEKILDLQTKLDEKDDQIAKIIARLSALEGKM